MSFGTSNCLDTHILQNNFDVQQNKETHSMFKTTRECVNGDNFHFAFTLTLLKQQNTKRKITHCTLTEELKYSFFNNKLL